MNADKPKTAVVLFNLGGPDSHESIKPFLFNFFMDRNIIRLPLPFRFLLAKMISVRRSRKEAGTAYSRLGGRSPLLDNTKAQAQALQAQLGPDYSVHIAMRYWHPMAPETVESVKRQAPQSIVLLPLYPQFSTTTSGSSLESWQKAAKTAGLDIPTSMICCYPEDAGLTRAAAQLVREKYDAMIKDGYKPRLLFSAHGLPESIIRDGDPYQWQCERTAQAVVDALDIQGLDWQICYQSRVGPQKWLGPSTEEALRKAAADGVDVLVYPHAFVSEHVETLVEIEEEYRHLAHTIGIKGFERVPTVSVQAHFIGGLADMVRARVNDPKLAASCGGRICPTGFNQCPMGKKIALPGLTPVCKTSPDQPCAHKEKDDAILAA